MRIKVVVGRLARKDSLSRPPIYVQKLIYIFKRLNKRRCKVDSEREVTKLLHNLHCCISRR